MLNIVVCVKAVPDPKEACKIKIEPVAIPDKQVDVGVAEDCRTFLPLLIEKINAYREQRITCTPAQDQ